MIQLASYHIYSNQRGVNRVPFRFRVFSLLIVVALLLSSASSMIVLAADNTSSSSYQYSLANRSIRISPTNEPSTLQKTTYVYRDGEQIASYNADAQTVYANMNSSNRYMSYEELSNRLSSLGHAPDKMSVTTENANPYYFQSSSIPNVFNSATVIGSSYSYVELTSGLKITGNQSPYILQKITQIIGARPKTVESTTQIFRSTTRYGTYQEFDMLNAKFTDGQVWVGNAKTKVIPISKTYYYSTHNFGYAIWVKPTGEVDTWDYEEFDQTDILLNKLGVEYPYWRGVDINGFLNSTPPDKTDFTAVSSTTNNALRTIFNNSVRDNFKTWYDKTYGYVDWVTTKGEIHHILPLQYGGTNDYSNLIPLYPDKHLQFTNWWKSY
ncbi:hypothetical protein PCCS19_34840 [Paenibacillus sp. CCS19]|uniref:HNH endonuclease signature motif containing protein n=1 Tax=Paenibacillus sp. CCS19 TaxID=3158387 RepID=UPI00256BDD44|nr:hypothetical protein [Paenibacillus cellulosilyticus]GMK40428.1 hypothetical protein PCCS19_34840 [Paenibacillus cellulosilyticus]